ncbi:uncharacterized protein LOC6584924 isoform X5 [Drosophila mojavensis]|uniref:Uncharacterized protein, isoform B n=1 Tax=Drosophila mojavensis TaxID=7230 RepID=A0A0Q9WNE3_DROMO|nr:uncharacterized protein LOC6584924 isoform X5 [Drosophila mojavensis]KRF94255.1 uncharacterized protein Dmoj_GI15997, isoform B [Drosophila mojavensis]
MWQPSTQHFLALIFCSAVCLLSASPLPLPAGNQELDVLQIPLGNGKEIDVLTLGAKDQDQLIADRNKRTIGLLRELFPDITKEINMQINRVVNNVLQRVGPVVLGTILNPGLTSPAARKPNADDDDDNDDAADNDANDVGRPLDKDYENLPDELTNFEPDKDFDSQPQDSPAGSP